MDDLNFRDDLTDSFGIHLADYRDHLDPYGAIEAERLRRGANPFAAMVFTYGQLEAVSDLPARGVRFSGFRDDESEEQWSGQDRCEASDWFRQYPGRHFRLCTALEREAAELVPLGDGFTALLASRWGPNDPVPVNRLLEVRTADIDTINAADDCQLETLFAAEPFVFVRRCSECFSCDVDLRGAGSPLSIVRNPPRKIELQRPASVAFGSCSELLNLTLENEKDLPKTSWLIPGELLSGYVTGLIAPGGTGKSARSLQLAIALGRGDGAAMGVKVARRTKVWVINREDDPNQQRKRVAAACKLFGYSPAGLQGWVHLLNSDLTGTCLAKRGRNGEAVEGPDVQNVAQYILDNDIGAVIIDPLVSMHGLKESDNDDMRFLFEVLKRIAKITGAAIYIIHHSNKPSGASSEGRAGDANSSRGASDIINAQRAAKTMYPMPQSEAKSWGVPAEICHKYVRIDDAKANLAALNGRPQWFEKVTVRIDNGEDSFALRPVQLGEDQRQTRCENLVAKLLGAAIGNATDAAGKLINFSPSPKARGNSNTALWLTANGAADFSVEEVRAALNGIEGLVIRVADYKSGGRVAKRYELC